MKLNKKLIFTAMASFGLMNTAAALEYDFENNPDGVRYFAKVVQQPILDDEGNEKMGTDGVVLTEDALAFSNQSYARPAENLHNIISAYGGSYDYANSPEGIYSYAAVEQVGIVDDEGNPILDDDGVQKTEPGLKFAASCKAWPAEVLHKIFTAYGLGFDFANTTSVSHYAKVNLVPKLDDEGMPILDTDGNPEAMPELAFAGGAKLWRASSINTIIGSYAKTE